MENLRIKNGIIASEDEENRFSILLSVVGFLIFRWSFLIEASLFWIYEQVRNRHVQSL